MILIILIFAIAITEAFVIRNLLNKVEAYEDDIQLKDEFLKKFKEMVNITNDKMKELDQKGAFESDDETGFIFQDMKSLSMGLSAYFQNYTTEEEKK